MDSVRNNPSEANSKRYGIARRALPYLVLCALLFGLAIGLSFAGTAQEVSPSQEQTPRVVQPLVGAEFA